jgi:hypothetical protein
MRTDYSCRKLSRFYITSDGWTVIGYGYNAARPSLHTWIVSLNLDADLVALTTQNWNHLVGSLAGLFQLGSMDGRVPCPN